MKIKLFFILFISFFFLKNANALDPKFGKYENIVLPDYFEKKLKNRNVKRVAGQELSFRFIKKKSSLSKYPGKAIEGMIWMELFYNESIKYPQAVQEDRIEGMWDAKTNLRGSMGLTNELSTQEVIDKYLVLRKILLQAKVKKVNIAPGLKKRKELLKDVKSKIKKAKKEYLENTEDDVNITYPDNENITITSPNENTKKVSRTSTKPVSTSIKERLIKLEELFELGLVTEEEYQTKKLEILDDL